MSPVGIVSVVVGVMAVCGRGFSLVWPAASLRWVKEMTHTNGRIRILGAFGVAVGMTMVWAGASEDSMLATLLFVLGGVIVVMSTPTMVLFPGVFRALANAFLPSDVSAGLNRWRMRGLAGVIAGALLIYYGALAL